MYEKIDFIWWYMGIIKEGVLPEAGSIIRTLTVLKMRHRFGWSRLGRDSKHRRDLLKNMAMSLIKHERIMTTLPKAKELRRTGDMVSDVHWIEYSLPMCFISRWSHWVKKQHHMLEKKLGTGWGWVAIYIVYSHWEVPNVYRNNSSLVLNFASDVQDLPSIAE